MRIESKSSKPAAAERAAGSTEYSRRVLHTWFKQMSRQTIVSGYCNITKNIIIDIDDHTGSRLLGVFGYHRDSLFRGVSGFIVDTEERKAFTETFLTKPMREAYHKGQHHHEMQCVAKFPSERRSRCIRISVDLVKSPENDDIIGFMSVKDVSVMQQRKRLSKLGTIRFSLDNLGIAI